MAKTEKNPGMFMVITFATLLVVNAVVVYLANLLFPQYTELGTAELSPLFALILSMGILALIGTFVVPFVREYEIKTGKMFAHMEWMALYFVVNAVAIWVISRFAFQLGFGISSFVVALVLAVVLDVAQGFAMMRLESYRK